MLNEREIILITTAILCSLRYLELEPGSKEQEEFKSLIFKLARMRRDMLQASQSQINEH